MFTDHMFFIWVTGASCMLAVLASFTVFYRARQQAATSPVPARRSQFSITRISTSPAPLPGHSARRGGKFLSCCTHVPVRGKEGSSC